MKTVSSLLLAIVLTSSVVVSQEILTPVSSSQTLLNVSANDRRVAAFGISGEDSIFLVHGSADRRIADAKLIAVSNQTQSPGELPLENYRSQYVAIGDKWIFTPHRIDGKHVGRVSAIRGGETRTFPLPGGVTFAAMLGDRLAVLGTVSDGTSRSSVLAVYDCATGSSYGEIKVPGFASVSFQDPETVLLVEFANLRITPVSLAYGEVRAQPSYTLSGPEANRSMERASGNLSGNSVSRLLIAHLPAKNGNNLFVLAPYKLAEGMRLVEYDRSGQQVKSFRLRAETEAALRSVSGPVLLALSPDSFTLAGQDGVLRKYQRP